MSGEPRVSLSLSDYDLRILARALSEATEGYDGDYDDEAVHMDTLAERIRQARRRLASRVERA
jgi:hypothetical protein